MEVTRYGGSRRISRNCPTCYVSRTSVGGSYMGKPHTERGITNERKYPYIVAIAIARKGLDIGLSRRIVAFHNARHIQLRHGRSAYSKGGTGEVYYRWCFSDLETARSFVEQFGGTIHPRRIAANIAKLPELLRKT